MKSKTEVCVLSDGRRVKYRVDKRDHGPCFNAYFRGPDGRKKEISTKETNRKRALDSAVAIIMQAFQPKSYFHNIDWDEAVAMMVERMEVDNLRPNTVSTYKWAIVTFRKVFPEVSGPGSVTPAMAEEYKKRRMKAKKSPHTVAGDLTELSTVFGKWWCDECKIIESNPFVDIEPPKRDKLQPRIISLVERKAFETWLAERWNHWRLPLLFLEVKSAIGCRIYELAAIPARQLREGRVAFEAVLAKGRKARVSKLPANLYDELLSIAGPTLVFERFPDQLREILLAKKRPQHAKCVKFPYDPQRLVNWLQDRLVEFRKERPDIPRFKLHNYRGTAMSRAKSAGVAYDDDAIAFGCNPETMRKHYITLDETAVSDAVQL